MDVGAMAERREIEAHLQTWREAMPAVLRSTQDAAAKDVKTAPVVTDYLTRGMKSTFTMPNLPSDAFPTAIPPGR